MPRTKGRSVGSVACTRTAFSGSGSPSGVTGVRTRAIVGEALCSVSESEKITWNEIVPFKSSESHTPVPGPDTKMQVEFYLLIMKLFES